jgi:hypothetical protein
MSLEKQIDAVLGAATGDESRIVDLVRQWCRAMEMRRSALIHPNLPRPECGFDKGGRFLRVWRKDGSSRGVVAFVDRKTGDVYKAASWKQKAPGGPRGNIIRDEGYVLSWDFTPGR